MLAPAVIIFDLDGTLVDSAEGIRRCFSLTLSEWGRDPAMAIPDEMIGPPLHVTFSSLGFASNEVDAVVATYRRHYAREGVRECRVYPGIAELLAFSRHHGISLGVATSKLETFAREILNHVGLSSSFGVVAGDSLERRRSKREIASRALEDLGTRRPAWMIGDRRFDMLAARELNLEPIGALWGYGTREELEDSGATSTLEGPGTLLDLLRNALEDADILDQ